jgi:hypothetical protein
MYLPLYYQTEKNIETFGFSDVGVSGTENSPSFNYTIGLSPQFGHEFIMIGLRPDLAHIIICDIVASLKSGLKLELDKIYEGEENAWANLPLMFKACDPQHPDLFGEYAIQLKEFYGKEKPVVQIVMSDRAGLLPGHPDFDHAYMDKRQPLLFKLQNNQTPH